MKERIVADGRGRAYEGSMARVRAEVAAEYRQALEKAPWWKRVLIRLRMDREVRRRARGMAPGDGLYASFRPESRD